MQTAVIVIGAVMGTLAVVAAWYGIRFLYLDLRRGRQEMVAAMNSLTDRCRDISAKAHLVEELGKCPGYIEGLVRVCETQVAAVSALASAVQKFHETLFGAETRQRDKDAWVAYEESDADRQAEINEMIANGYSPVEARERAKAMGMALDLERRKDAARERFTLGG